MEENKITLEPGQPYEYTPGKIPNSFYLFGQRITVEYNETLLHDNNAVGEARYRDNKIVLQRSTGSNPVSESKQLQIFYHELVHFILYFAGQELYKNEDAVEIIAHLLTQYELTKETQTAKWLIPNTEV